MKTSKITVIFIAILMAILAQKIQAQIALENTYSNVPGTDFFGIIHLQNSGDKYVLVSATNPKVVKIYNLDHSQWKEINLSSFPDGYVLIQYVSENLFTNDGKICVLLIAYNVINAPLATVIVNEDSQVIFQEFGFSPQEGTNSPAIFNTSDGAKMRLISAGTNQEAKIYSLPGTLVDVSEIGIMGSKGSISSFPNPTSGSVTIKYNLPDGENSGKITLYNTSGHEVKTYEIDRVFNDLKISTSDLPAGNYLWQLKAGNYQTIKKMIVIK